jgi:hypothetical protein
VDFFLRYISRVSANHRAFTENSCWIVLRLLVIVISGLANDSAATESEKQICAAYGGSASCRECHEQEYQTWSGSHHALAERAPDAKLDDAAFVPSSTFQNGAQKTFVCKTNGQFEIVATGLKSSQENFQIEGIIGVSPLRQMLVPFSNGRLQAAEAAYDPRSNQWFDVFGAENRKPGEWGH